MKNMIDCALDVSLNDDLFAGISGCWDHEDSHFVVLFYRIPFKSIFGKR
jgi:hypothetical protein